MKSVSDNHPLISFCIKSYNQKHFIGEALKAAFAQTYSPLEIVISDNHSTDGSDEVIRDLITQYQEGGGVHKVIYQRNETNIGMVKNAEKAYLLSHGALCVQADGDDISRPNRVSRIVEEWVKGGMTATVIYHWWESFDDDGCYRGRAMGNIFNFKGAACAYSREVVTKFRPIVEKDAADDNIFVIRGLLLGPELLINEVLLDYRLGGVSNNGESSAKHSRIANMTCASCRQSELDIESVKDGCGAKYDLHTYINQVYRYYATEYLIYNSPSFIVRLYMFMKRRRGRAYFIRRFLCDITLLLPKRISWRCESWVESLLYKDLQRVEKIN